MRVYGELPSDAAGVEAPVIDPGTLPPGGGVRRWGWLPVAAVGITALVLVRLAPDRGWDLPDWVSLVGAAACTVAVVGMLLRYLDDRQTARSRLDRAALASESGTESTIATVIRRYQSPSTSHTAEAVDVAFETADGPVTLRWVMGIGVALLPPLPRVGDPVAVWTARERRAVLLRYERAWAEDVLKAWRGQRGGRLGSVGRPRTDEADHPGDA